MASCSTGILRGLYRDTTGIIQGLYRDYIRTIWGFYRACVPLFRSKNQIQGVCWGVERGGSETIWELLGIGAWGLGLNPKPPKT